MDFTLSPEIEDVRLRTRRFVEAHVLPLEADPGSYDDHENIRLDVLRAVAQTKYEVLVAEMGVVAHDMPDKRTRTDRCHRFR